MLNSPAIAQAESSKLLGREMPVLMLISQSETLPFQPMGSIFGAHVNHTAVIGYYFCLNKVRMRFSTANMSASSIIFPVIHA